MTQHDSLPELPWADPPEPNDEVSRRIRRDCTQNIEKARGMSALQRGVLSLVLSASVVGLLTYLSRYTGRTDTALRAALFGAVGWGLVHAAVLFVGLVRPPGKRGSRLWRFGLAISLPIAFVAYLALAANSSLPFNRFLHEGVGHTVACGVHAVLFGALVSGGMLFLWRGTDPLTPGLSGAIAGLLGGLAGAVGIGVSCPSGETWHLWIAHGSAVVLFVGVGFWAGRKWLSP